MAFRDEASEQQVVIPIKGVDLEGTLSIPRGARGIVLFAHGSGSSRFSPRNAFVAIALQQARIATLLFDLLSEDEATDRGNVFDIGFLAERLLAATEWVRANEASRRLEIGYFGASTGAAAALEAAALSDVDIKAVVSRGGRPDLAEKFLARVRAPTLLIVGERDPEVIRMNEEAYEMLTCKKTLEIVPRATHLFEEKGTLDQVVRLAVDWYRRHLNGPEMERSEQG